MVAGSGVVAAVASAAVFAVGGATAGHLGRVDGGAGAYEVRSEARFSPPGAFVASRAVTYDMALVPAGARIVVTQHGGRGQTDVSVRVGGLLPARAYGARVSQEACGGDPAAAGGEYQHRRDPVQPSEDPAYANPENEVWLDFTTDADGAGAASAWHGWEFRPGGARSVTLRAAPGGAGARVACFAVPFAPPGAGAA